jgi:hypothetical protein
MSSSRATTSASSHRTISHPRVRPSANARAVAPR